MDRSSSNALNVLGLISLSAFVILVSGFLFLLAICASSLGNVGGRPSAGETAFDFGLYIAAFGSLAGGIALVVHFARRMVRQHGTELPLAPQVEPRGRREAEQQEERPPLSIPNSPPLARANESLPPLPQPAAIDVATHLSPAGAVVVQQLAAAITAKIGAEIMLGLVGWYGATGLSRMPFPLYRFGFIVWGFAAIAPHIVLLYMLFRRPGRTSFAYALVIPSIHILFGIFGHSALLALILRAGQIAAPTLSIVPWILDILILYLAWKAIRLTGLLPNPRRLVSAAIVIFLYTSLLPALFITLNQIQR